MPELKFGITFPLGQQDFKDVRKVEEWGFDSLWVGEHIFFHGPTPDALSILAAFAVLTERIQLGTSIVLLPLRPPAVVAKQATTVDVISEGRLILGVGVGGEYPKEFEACGVPVNERGARANESIRILRKLWTEDEVTYEGRFYRMPGVTLKPKPVRPGGPPIWVSGRSEGAMKRAAHLGDGYMPYLFSPERYRDGLSKVREYAEKADRDPESIVPALYQFVCVKDDYEEARQQAAAWLGGTYQQSFDKLVDRYVVFGNPEACLKRLEEFAEAGVRHFALVPLSSSNDDFYAQAEACAREIVPKMKAR